MGGNIRETMAKKGLTINQLAVKTKIPVPTVANYIRGRSFPNLENLTAISNTLKVKPRDLIVKKEITP
jgi:transcriptional regulator with XRE-family HTH domain